MVEASVRTKNWTCLMGLRVWCREMPPRSPLRKLRIHKRGRSTTGPSMAVTAAQSIVTHGLTWGTIDLPPTKARPPTSEVL